MKNITYNYFIKLHNKIDKIVGNYVKTSGYDQTTCDETYEYYLEEKATKNQIKQLKNNVAKLLEEDGLETRQHDNTIEVYGKSDVPYMEVHIYTIDDNDTLCIDIIFVE